MVCWAFHSKLLFLDWLLEMFPTAYMLEGSCHTEDILYVNTFKTVFLHYSKLKQLNLIPLDNIVEQRK